MPGILDKSKRIALAIVFGAALSQTAYAAALGVVTISTTDSTTVAEPAGTVISLTATTVESSGCDADDYAWTATGGTFSASSSASTNWTFPVAGGPATYTLTVRVTDRDERGGSCTPDTDTQIVTITNVPPDVSVSGGGTTVSEGTVVSYGCAATDVPADTLTYAWTFEDSAGDADPGTTTGATTAAATHAWTQSGSSGETKTATCTVSDGPSSVSDAATTTVTNLAPTVSAVSGGGTEVEEGTAVTYTCTAADPGSDALSYTWAFTDGGVTTYPAANRATHTWTQVGRSSAAHTATCTVSDGSLSHSLAAATTTVTNALPVISSVTGSVSAVEGTVVTYTCAASDPGSDTLTYSWSFTDTTGVADAGATTGDTTAVATHAWTQSGSFAQVKRATCTVSDDAAATATMTATTSVTNAPPAVSSITGGGTTVSEGTAVSYVCTGTDPGADSLSYAWTFTDSSGAADTGASTGATTASATHTWTHSGSADEVKTARCTVTDDGGATGTSTVTTTVSNVGPSISSVSGGGTTVDEGVVVSYSCFATDVGSDTLTYSWAFTSAGGTTDSGPSTGTTSSTATHAWTQSGVPDATKTATCTVSDGGATSPSLAVTTIVTNASPAAPAISGGGTTVAEGVAVTYECSTTDPGLTDTLSYAWVFTDATTGVVDTGISTGAATATASHEWTQSGSAPESKTARCTVTDDGGESGTSTVNTTVADAPPSISTVTGGGSSVAEGVVVTYRCIARDAGSDALTYSWAFTDASSAVDSGPSTGTTTATATHAWTQSGSSPETKTATCTVTDDAGGTDSDAATTTVTNESPSVTSISGGGTSEDEGSYVTYGCTATDAGLTDTLTYAWTFTDTGSGEADSGPSTGTTTPTASHAWIQSGTADQSKTARCTVTDDGGRTGTSTVTNTVSNVAPSVSIDGDASADEGDTVTYTCSASDPSDTTFSYTWSFSDTVGTTSVSSGASDSISHTWSQTGGATSSSTVGCSVSDGAGAILASVTGTITNLAPVVTLTSFGGDEGTAIAFSAVVTDPGNDTPLTYLWEFGDGNISADVTPTHSYLDHGTYTVALTVTDPDGGISVRTTSTAVILNVAPVVVITSDAPLYAAAEGDTIEYRCNADDTDTGLTYSWVFTDTGSTALTEGDAVATHTWAQAGGASTSYTVTCTVNDGSDASFEDVDVLVDNLPPEIDAASAPEATLADAEAYTFTPTATDPGGDLFGDWSYTLEPTPVGPITFVASAGRLTWTPSYLDAGSFVLTMTANDADGATDTQPWSIVVTATDTDDDGLSDGAEVAEHDTDPADADSDDDGLDDGEEVLIYRTDPNDSDSDDDGLTDAEDIDTYETDPDDADSDDDGLTDGAEVFIHLTDPNDPDSDDDGIDDGEEIALGGDPNNSDDDGDSVPTLDEWDRDGDDVADDTDGDSIPDFLDTDDDDDGLATALELIGLDVNLDSLVDDDELSDGDPCWTSDLDCDGLPAHRDEDDDGDGVPTQWEILDTGASLDTDCDGSDDHLDADDDGDTISTSVELELAGMPLGADGIILIDPEAALGLDQDLDGAPDHLDDDDDDDGVPTAVEVFERLDVGAELVELVAFADADADGDGVYDHWEDDADGDGVADADEYTLGAASPNACLVPVVEYTARDTDGDGTIDPFDNNDDGDTVLTVDELDLDTDGDGVLDYLEGDDDGDGMLDPEDCNDYDATVNPSATESIDDGRDQDCDGFEECYLDADSDGYRSEDTTAIVYSSDFDCADLREGSASEPATDCDDTDENVHPFAIDSCETFGTEQVDDDCNGDVSTYVDEAGVLHNSVPEGGEFPFYIDQDHDGYGDADASPIYPCAPPVAPTDEEKAEGVASYSPTNGDCNDANPYVHPGAEELCNGVDEDCDDEADDAASLGENSGCRDLFADHDVDGYGSTDPVDQLCLCYDGAPDDVDVGGPTDVGGVDSDDDDLSDVDERGYYGTNPDDADSDADGLSDGEEVLSIGSDPLLADSDGDGLDDSYEVAFTLTDPTRLDSDADGLDDGEEEALATNPLEADSDGGGTSDGVELADGTDPLDAGDDVADTLDTDGDGLTDRQETLLGSDPNLTDTDEDGLADSVESVRGTSPVLADSDGGGTSDGDEGIQGTNPLDASDDLRFEASACPGVDARGDGYEVTSDGTCWTAQTGDCYDYDTNINPGAIERIDGDDNDCDGTVPSVELDCDEDGSFALDPSLLSLSAIRDYDSASLGLTACTAGVEYPLSCFQGETVRLTCDRSTLLWVASRSDDVVTLRFNGGKRLYAAGRTCTTDGDCDDNCPARCPDAAEACDGIDNDCDEAGAVVDLDGDGVLDTMQSELDHVGFVSADEIDLDGDGFIVCEGLPTGVQAYRTLESCDTTIVDHALFGDCNDECSLSRPDATEERCNGLLDICNGAAEGSDGDGDGFATCGAWSGTDGSAILEDAYLVVWYTPGTDEEGDTGDTADTGVGTSDEVVPLLLPRLEAAECDAELNAEVSRIVGADHLDAAIFAAADARPADAVAPLLAACIQAEIEQGPSRCAVARITIDQAADAGLDDAEVNPAHASNPDCAAHPEQQTLRTVWSRERILQARRLVEEWECYRLSGTFGCGDASPEGYWETLPDFSDDPAPGGRFSSRVPDAALTTDARWWQELTRFTPVSAANGILSGCWAEDDADEITGGDCVDASGATNREGVEGPADLLVAFYELDPECDSCLDGVDNNCNSLIDCDEPACAACFAGNGLGCASSDSPCGQAGCAASAGSRRLGDLGGSFLGLALMALATTFRRRA